MTDSLWLQYPDDYDMCQKCTGIGYEYCSICGGSGGRYETRYDYDYEGRPISRDEHISCSACSGSGQKLCRECGGTGWVRKSSYGRQRHASTSYTPGYTGVEEQPPRADVQFAEHTQSLVYMLKNSVRLPNEVTALWISLLKSIDCNQPESGLETLSLLSQLHEEANRTCQPQRDVFDLAFTSSMEFYDEMQKIKYELDCLEVILKHIKTYFEEHT